MMNWWWGANHAQLMRQRKRNRPFLLFCIGVLSPQLPRFFFSFLNIVIFCYIKYSLTILNYHRGVACMIKLMDHLLTNKQCYEYNFFLINNLLRWKVVFRCDYGLVQVELWPIRNQPNQIEWRSFRPTVVWWGSWVGRVGLCVRW